MKEYGKMEIGISLGSNKENRVRYLQLARNMICSEMKAKLKIQSSIYETSPVDVKKEYQNKFYLNSFIILSADIEIEKIWICLNKIEKKLGRVRTNEINIPREIDIDVIYIDQKIINTKSLIVPHPRWYKRMFVLISLNEVNPNLVLPLQSQSVKKLYKNLNSNEEVKLYAKEW